MVDVSWEEWKLDATFLADLDRWAAENPETSLDRLLQQICTAIDPIQGFFDIIPDGSFPARGLVKSLAHVVSLGKIVTSADRDTYYFAMDVVKWVDDTRKAFSARKRRMIRRDFTRATWANLQEMRWAAARLLNEHRTLSKPLNKIQVPEEMKTFKQRLSDARAMFNASPIQSRVPVYKAKAKTLKFVKSENARFNPDRLEELHKTESEILTIRQQINQLEVSSRIKVQVFIEELSQKLAIMLR
ncbi:hypothetical protein C0992_005337 [Termitomyces sp. T32_za158]|nr:hypothetical protein C0992_005337 [Termitomyces sp. T32_za158]